MSTPAPAMQGSYVRRKLPYNVVTAARKRIINAFSNGVPVHMSLSGGKDSITLAHLVTTLIEEGRIDPDLLTVVFVDEEAMHDSVIEEAKRWRRIFMNLGVQFDWYCIEVRHFNCFNALEQDESFICWDSTCPDRWVRPMPSFAITDHPLLRRRTDTYQAFLARISQNAISMTGVRVAESVQRLHAFNNTFDSPESQLFLPIYDWRDSDVWRYLRDHEIPFPDTYINLYASGESKRQMRLSQFFSVDTARCLVKLAEYDDDLMDRVIRREPNAYLAALYWDTDIFRSSIESTKNAEENEHVDYRAEAMRMLNAYFVSENPYQQRLARRLRQTLFKWGHVMERRDWGRVYRTLLAGDPKLRTARAIENTLAQKGALNAISGR